MQLSYRARLVLLFLRCCSCRFTVYYWVGYMAGLEQTGRASIAWSAAGLALWLAWCLGIEIVNRVADREADLVDRPERTAMCEEIGFARLRVLGIAAWACFLGIGGVMLAVAHSAPLAVMLAFDVFLGVNYSVGLTFKRRRVLSVAALSLSLVSPMVTGWSVSGQPAGLLRSVLPAAAVLAAFSIGLSGIKDITDVVGDRLIGYSSLWLALVRTKRGIAVYAALGIPFLFIVAWVGAGFLRWTTLLTLPLAAASVAVVAAASRATSPAERAVAREVMHTYTFVFACAFLLSFQPGPVMAISAAAGLAAWALASRTLHWSGGLDTSGLHTWWHLLVPATPAPSNLRSESVH